LNTYVSSAMMLPGREAQRSPHTRTIP
jgi:hypothetical protein